MTVRWRKSSRSGAINDEACVEVAGLSGGIGIRDSKNPDGEQLTIPGDQFKELVRLIKGEVFDRP